MRTLSDGALIGHDNGCSQGQFPSLSCDLVDTPVHAHSLQAKLQLSERKGRSFDTGVRTLSTCGGQDEKAAAAHHFIVTITRVLAWVLRSHQGAHR